MSEIDLSPLAVKLSGTAVGPADDGWDAARQAWNLVADQQPVAVVLAQGADDVIATVDFARERGLRVAAQSTGHAAAAMSSLEDTVLLRTAGMAAVEIDAGSRRARVGSGAKWGDVNGHAAEHGLIGLSGSSATVGVTGYTLGGGFGWLGRAHGLAASSVQAIEVVTADGGLVRADADNEADLFWALRGGGGNFGAVTALEFSLYPYAEVYGGMIAWPAERGAEVFAAFNAWRREQPDEMSGWARFLTLPPFPEVPEPLRGVPVVDVTAAYAGPEAEGAELMRPLFDLGDPIVDTFGTIPATGLGTLAGDPVDPVPALGDGDLLAELPDEALDALVGVAGPGSGSPLLMVQLRPLGGALSRPSANGGATAHLDAELAVYSVGVAMDAESGAAAAAHVSKVREALRPWSAKRRYLNFVDVSAPAAQSFDEATFSRLRQVKSKYDPDGLFRANHEVAPA
ncbi:MAG TPA: FAD-binding protein [Thermoleophilaceae bacterium]|nr:FAD-binding protein [Thermoleophilaceae bacterium]